MSDTNDVGQQKPQAPRSISVESVDRGSRPAPYNPGGTPNGACETVAGEPKKGD